ncbi:MAG: biotin transporter BioY [Candidatus Gastranaerophilales bacterium]|nr:biotin transporter BioY [Candidatus Gastranaerophilales bacterium]
MMNKRVKEGIKKFHTKNPRIKFCLGTLALVGLCVMFLIIATFTQIKFNMSDVGLDSYLKFEYIPQIPVVLFIAALLGECWGLLTILLYIGFGLTGIYPVFALGGGLSYVFQYNFGYILAFIFAVILVSKEFKKGTSFLNLILATLSGVFIIHIIGILYLTIIAMLNNDSFEMIINLIYYQSISKMLYDIVLGFLAILIAKGSRRLLWIIMG